MKSVMSLVTLALLGLLSATNAFVTVSKPAMTRCTNNFHLHMSAENNDQQPPVVKTPATRVSTVERGVSIDQDGKSNVWAIEPKMEVDTRSGEEKSGGAIVAVAGLAVAGAIAAFTLTNLPDPNSF